MTLALRLLLLLSLSVPAAAAYDVSVFPEGPTSSGPVELRVPYSCSTPISGHTVERTGAQIVVRLVAQAVLCDPAAVNQFWPVSLGVLPPGRYHVRVVLGPDENWASGSFIVRNGDETPFEVHPFAVPTTGAPSIVIEPRGPTTSLCPSGSFGPTVSIDGVDLPNSAVTCLGFRALRVALPDHAAGLASVRVRVGDFDATAPPRLDATVPAALYFFDRSQPPDLTVFERILFPVLYDGGGAFGSRWVTEVAMANAMSWNIETFNVIDPGVCVSPLPCFHRILAGEIRKFRGSGYPKGVALLVPRRDADDLSFSVRARDLSRQDKGFGTAVPVVREKDMFYEGISLLDVPVDPRFRSRLRVYSFNPFFELGGGARAIIVRADGTRTTASWNVIEHCTTNCETTPFYAELDLPAGAQDERVNVYVYPSPIGVQPAWAFVSVTNNDTQEVTLVLPDGTPPRE